jgi:hypothetical protein
MPILKLDPAPLDARVAVARVHGNYHLVATEAIQVGERILRIEGEFSAVPSRYSVQVDTDLHVEVPAEASLELVLDRYFWRFLNHSCSPTAILRGRDVIARRRIKPWDEVTFDYDSTEYDMAEPFQCRCGSPQCRGTIRGYRHLSAAQRRRLRPRVAAFLLLLAEGEAGPASMETSA